MKPRMYKRFAIALTGGVLLQFGGCGGGFGDIFAQLIISTVLRGIIEAFLGTGGTTV